MSHIIATIRQVEKDGKHFKLVFVTNERRALEMFRGIPNDLEMFFHSNEFTFMHSSTAFRRVTKILTELGFIWCEICGSVAPGTDPDTIKHYNEDCFK